MAKVVTVGGSISGLAAALILSRRGHDVTVVERDPDPTPADSDEAWRQWRRRGVPHLRGTHMFAARSIAVLRHHLPDVLAGLKEAGGREVPAGDQVTRLNCRRTTYELVLRRAALGQCGVRFLAGTEVTGLIPAPRTTAGAPRVVGVYTGRGDVLAADLVVDGSGRGSRLGTWLRDIGIEAPGTASVRLDVIGTSPSDRRLESNNCGIRSY